MTALAGLWNFGGTPAEAPEETMVARMLAAQAIYGKHDALTGVGPLAFGRRLWPSTPEDTFDTGPVRAADGTILLVADIRIDNRAELAEALGLSLGGVSDPALVAAVIARWGNDGIARIVGPFALAVWHARDGLLTLARDALGERPLHYHRGDGFVAFASMPKGLHAHPAVDYAADPKMAADFLALVPETGGESFFSGIERVPPGHIVTLTRATVQAKRYWTPDLSPFSGGGDSYAEAMRAELDRAVACRLHRAGGGVGSHLSAGLDSSIVTATAAHQLGPERLAAFTAVPSQACVVAEGQIADEGPLAAATAALYPNIDHVRVAPGGASPLDLMDRQFQLFERPVLNPSNAVWNEAINDAAKVRGVTVLLTGQMGNMSISHDGYPHLAALSRRGGWSELAMLLRQLHGGGARIRHLAAATLGPLLPPALWQSAAKLRGHDLPLERYSALRQEAFGGFGVAARATARGLDLSYRPWADGAAMRLWVLRRVDMGVYNKGTLAGWGIDLRDPTADRRLIEFALRVPEGEYIRDGVPRALARRAFADRLPAEVAGERRRGLQGADWHVGMAAARGQIAAELDSFERCAGATDVVDVARLKQALADWPEDGWHDPETTWLYRHAMLRGVAAGHFLRKVARTN